VNWGIPKSSFILLLVFAAGLAGMLWRILSAEPQLVPPGERPDVEVESEPISQVTAEKLSLVHSRAGAKERILRFERAFQRPGPRGPTYEVESPRVLMARVRDIQFTLEADQGWFDPATGNLRLAGNVHAASGADREFFAEQAVYRAESDELVARGGERPLRLIDGGSTIEARALKTDGRFENIEIRGAAGEVGMDLVGPGEATDR